MTCNPTRTRNAARLASRRPDALLKAAVGGVGGSRVPPPAAPILSLKAAVSWVGGSRVPPPAAPTLSLKAAVGGVAALASRRRRPTLSLHAAVRSRRLRLRALAPRLLAYIGDLVVYPVARIA